MVIEHAVAGIDTVSADLDVYACRRTSKPAPAWQHLARGRICPRHGNELDNEMSGAVNADSTLLGLGGDDTLLGGFGDDTLDGGEGDDALYGAFGE